ncbi:DMT family transporter [Tepidibacter formicigenes]|jgi:drug/metabolite transporter (DMT)-like permease|uniref:Permease of the drug/metabolite transporter (DMT) superfamily n=1 Tax=Tepidibacter formicigenes DSM 15518 TaxID=1123349 RepID=A0A1M6NV90_9FIRM|nr:DMT family transporter [Tepidibacter formicigenes]SHJ99626.1 Permease of the drug/metabolite transporter (DMT) superfamily [Tepidibacter formicigenes DSM 15518]
MDNKRFYPNIAIIITVILWGLSFISIKVSLEVFPPMTLAAARFIIASGILLAIFKKKEPKTKLEKEDIPKIAMASFIGVTLYYYFENNGVKLTTPSIASLIIATIPIFSLISEAIMFKNKLTLNKIIGVTCSLIGVYFIVGGGLNDLTSSNGLGYLMMFGAVFSWVIYNMLTKPLFNKYSQLAIVFYQIVFGTIFLIPFTLFEKTNWELLNKSIILNIFYLAVFCSAVAYYLYMYALDNLGASTTTLYLNLSPLVTTIGSYFILHENITKNTIIGGILVIASVYTVNLKISFKKDKIEDVAKFKKV